MREYLNKIYEQTENIFQELIHIDTENIKYRKIDLCLLSGSISKVEGSKIDTLANPDIAMDICKCLWTNKPSYMNFAVQCCEHLNKAIILEKDLADRLLLEEVLVYPTEKAGGTFASVAYSFFNDPVIVENVKADAGIDIGLNIIGMNLKPVPQSIPLNTEFIGKARVVCARTRLKLIDGERSSYSCK
ncbi:hypothetical protein CLPU_3c00530 [Gottschalkia purinilytica]|uniref:Uncharacterized protein n=1 Tax=Gottschalkia purinilytica TaxID=1503 RepID=A0A0L0WCY4_GOTPU|nr:DUF436 family protein [Gottschalkia purinilytica]KNF09275.1 hypothetical protein CLPU_3c00530 [Gottschalkia purinilytica]